MSASKLKEVSKAVHVLADAELISYTRAKAILRTLHPRQGY
jgi:hypothetical protein